MNDNISSDLDRKKELQDNNIKDNNLNKKRKHSQLEKNIIKLNYLSNLKIRKKYNCTKKIYEKSVINWLLNNANCHLVSQFKEKMLTDYIDEFLRREYSFKESNERIPKFAIYYKNYLLFFCQPTFSNFAINDILNDYGERRAELYYKNNYQGGKSNDEDLGFEESDSEEESPKDIKFKNNENGEIFDNTIKENIDNVTIMTTVNNSKNNTINLNLNNEKIEVFSENKCDVSNDTTLQDLMDIVKKGQQAYNNRKTNKLFNSITNNNIDNNYENSNSNNNYTNNKSKKNHKNKKKNDILNIIDYKKAMLNRGEVGHHKHKKKEGSKSNKKQHLEKNNINTNINANSKGNKIKNKFSVEKFQKLFKKGNNIKNLNLFKKNIKFPINNFLNAINDKNNINHEKKNTNSNLKKPNDKEIIDKEKEIPSKNVNKKFSNHSVNLNVKNKSISKDKDQDKKNTKNNTNNRFYNIKNSYVNFNNNLLQSNFHKNNYNAYIGGGGHTSNKNYSKSRNNTGFLYKQQSNTNNIINNNIMYNLNNIYNTTSLHKLYKNLNNINRNNGYLGKINPFKTLNFMQTTNHYHQRMNNNFIQINNDNRYHISNTSQDNKSSSLKILVTDLNNASRVKPTIKLRNEKDLIKSKYNNRDNNIFDLNHNKNHRITKSYNNLNLNNMHLNNNGITSYNNLKYKNKKFYYNSKINPNLKNIKNNQINSNSSNKNKKGDGNNKELMQLALSLLFDNNSTFSNIVGSNIHHNHLINKKSFISRNSNKKNSIKKSKTNKNKYHSNNTNYNININNQININTNGNNLYNNLKNGKDYLNMKLKNQELNTNNNILKDSNLHISNCNGVNNHNHNSENINLNKKVRARNISGLKKGNFQINKNVKNEENIIKSYHTKSVSSLTDLINHNKKMMGLYKNVSKSKSKEHKKNY